ncbi:MAG: polysaccharide pyruvyl transferase family protein [Hyphomicrobiaceae bacterium]|nr:polysaccharide pyruvyl transferase family protein [Hyphomicrobiaceae bacterium]
MGNFGSGNLGNDGSLEAMIDFLRTSKPDAELVCICVGPEEVKEQFNIPTLPIRSAAPRHRLLDRIPLSRTALNMLHTLATARKFDVLIAPGTGLLDDYNDTPWGIPVILATWCAGARLSRTKVAFVSIGAGPIVHPVSRWLMKTAARLVHYRSYRDQESKDYLLGIGLKVQRDPVYPDLAFGLPAPLAPAAPPASGKPLTIGVGVMKYYGWRGNEEDGAGIYRGYRDKLVQFILRLLDRRMRVRLLVGDGSDVPVRDEVLAALAAARPDYPREAVVHTDPTRSLGDVMEQMADTDFVVATRFHNIVCALHMRRPCISIGYAPKFDVLMAEMGLERFCQHVEQLDVDLLITQLDELMAGEARYRHTLDTVNRAYESRLAEQERALLTSILA